MELVDADRGMLPRHLFDALIPVRHRDRNAVAFGGRRHVLLRTFPGKVERKAQHAVDAMTSHDCLLHNELALGSLEHSTPDRRIFALGVLSYHDEIDCLRRPRISAVIDQRRADARHQFAGAQIDVLIELAPELDQRAPQRHMVRHGRRPAARAEENGVSAFEPGLPVGRHHRAVLGVVVAAREVVVFENEIDRKSARRSVQRPQALRYRFFSDAVAGDYCNLVLHCLNLCFIASTCASLPQLVLHYFNFRFITSPGSAQSLPPARARSPAYFQPSTCRHNPATCRRPPSRCRQARAHV